jgi:hypothetical protein
MQNLALKFFSGGCICVFFFLLDFAFHLAIELQLKLESKGAPKWKPCPAHATTNFELEFRVEKYINPANLHFSLIIPVRFVIFFSRRWYPTRKYSDLRRPWFVFSADCWWFSSNGKSWFPPAFRTTNVDYRRGTCWNSRQCRVDKLRSTSFGFW